MANAVQRLLETVAFGVLTADGQRYTFTHYETKAAIRYLRTVAGLAMVPLKSGYHIATDLDAAQCQDLAKAIYRYFPVFFKDDGGYGYSTDNSYVELHDMERVAELLSSAKEGASLGWVEPRNHFEEYTDEPLA